MPTLMAQPIVCRRLQASATKNMDTCMVAETEDNSHGQGPVSRHALLILCKPCTECNKLQGTPHLPPEQCVKVWQHCIACADGIPDA